jgi:antitoxin MazE
LKTKIIKIGNSQGLRIPKVLLQEYELYDTVELERGLNSIIIKPVKSKARKNWAQAFKNMSQNNDDVLIGSHFMGANIFDKDEWEW